MSSNSFAPRNLDVMEHIGKWHYLMGRSKYLAWYVHMLQHWPYCESEDFNVIKNCEEEFYFNFLPKLCRYFADTTSSIWKKQYMHNLASVARTLRVTCILLSRFPRRHVTVVGSDPKNRQIMIITNSEAARTYPWPELNVVRHDHPVLQFHLKSTQCSEVLQNLQEGLHSHSLSNTGQGVTGEIPPWPHHCCS